MAYTIYRIRSELKQLNYYGYTSKKILNKRLIEHKSLPNKSIQELIKCPDIQIFPLETWNDLVVCQQREKDYIKNFDCVNIRGKKLVTKDNTKRNNLDCKDLVNFQSV